MIMKHALPMFVLLLGGCAAKERQSLPIPVVAEQRLCPAFPLPPEALLKPPVMTDFLTPQR